MAKSDSLVYWKKYTKLPDYLLVQYSSIYHSVSIPQCTGHGIFGLSTTLCSGKKNNLCLSPFQTKILTRDEIKVGHRDTPPAIFSHFHGFLGGGNWPNFLLTPFPSPGNPGSTTCDNIFWCFNSCCDTAVVFVS